MKLGSKKKKGEYHSVSKPQRIEIIPDRLYIHTIPQLMDNLGYLVVACVPSNDNNNNGAAAAAPPVAFLVDCGDAETVAQQIHDIGQLHYHKQTIQVHMILSTHKHHDHTAGNRSLLRHRKIGKTIQKVVGGAVERVPCCNTRVANGDVLDLPRINGNDMNELVVVEVIAVPSHTRGSIAFQLSCKAGYGANEVGPCLFTGDTMFSGGGGVPFEADWERPGAQQSSPKRKATDFIRASAGGNAVERCFAELLIRSHALNDTAKPLIFPGHEYTSELLNRQMQGSTSDAAEWNKLPPSAYFNTVSQLYVAFHRRSLPHGKMLTVPTPLILELDINPHLRKMKKRGLDVLRALRLWYRVFSRGEIPEAAEGLEDEKEVVLNGTSSRRSKPTNGSKTPSTDDVWNVGMDDVNRTVFTTVYTAELDGLIHDLGKGRVDPKEASKRLEKLKATLEAPVIGRRPIPGTLPTDKLMYNAALGLVLLGSPPSAFTRADSVALKIPPPMAPDMTNRIRISKRRLTAVLKILRVASDAKDWWAIENMIDLLWREAAQYGIHSYTNQKAYATIDSEDPALAGDIVELGVLKWMLYGIDAGQPSRFPRFCMPCGSKPISKEHPIQTLKLRRTNGELVRHDVLTCPLCRSAAGCPFMDEEEEKEEVGEPFMINGSGGNGDGAEDEEVVQVSTVRLQFSTERRNSIPFDETESVELEMVANPM